MLRNIPNIQFIGACSPQVLRHSWRPIKSRARRGLGVPPVLRLVTLQDPSPAAGIRDVKAITGLCKPHLHKGQAAYKKPSVSLSTDAPKDRKDKHSEDFVSSIKSKPTRSRQQFHMFYFEKFFFLALRSRSLLRFDAHQTLEKERKSSSFLQV